MPSRELVVLGTASQAPTRARNHNGYLLRWDDESILFDPGEGTQRQLLLAGVAAPSITRICITHFHGDHCLGLPGVIQRLNLDRVDRPIDVYFPARGQAYFERLRAASIFDDRVDLRSHPVAEGGIVAERSSFRLIAEPLDHRVDCFGWRVEEPDGRRMLPDRLEAHGVRGPDVGRLQRDGTLEVDGRSITLGDVSEHRAGQSAAFVMDTKPCEGATRLAGCADLLVCESTYLEGEADLAEAYGHMTARQAAGLAAANDVRRLVLTHLSQRHPDEADYLAEAAPIHADVVVARDLDRVPVPARR